MPADIAAFSCYQCGLNPSNGVSVFRINPTGQPGIWACKDHCQPKSDIAEMVADLESARDMGISARDAAEILGAKVVG